MLLFFFSIKLLPTPFYYVPCSQRNHIFPLSLSSDLLSTECPLLHQTELTAVSSDTRSSVFTLLKTFSSLSPGLQDVPSH